jgi:hypothetical protein
VYEKYLAMYPSMNGTRARFTRLAIATGHWTEAHPHFVALGDKPPTTYFPDPAEYARFRRRAAKAAGVAAKGVQKEAKPSDAVVPF